MSNRKFINIILLILVIFMSGLYVDGVVAALVTPKTAEQIEFYGSAPYKSFETIRSTAILTNSYVDTDVLDIRQLSKFAVLFDLTQGSLTSIEYRIFISFDQINWFIEATETIAAGLITDTPSNGTVDVSAGNTKYFKIFNCYAPYIKLSIKGTGTVTASAAVVHIAGVI